MVAGRDLLFYNDSSGIWTLGQIRTDGTFATVSGRDDQFRSGWTHIVAMGRDLLFYNKAKGNWTVGRMSSTGTFTKYSEPDGHFRPGWSHIVVL